MRALVRLFRVSGPRGAAVLLAIGLGAATVGSSVGLLATSAYLISAAALRPSIAALSLSIVGVRFFGLARGVLRYAERVTSHAASLDLVARLRTWFYTAIEPLMPGGLPRARSGDLLALAVSDLEGLQDVVARVMSPPAVTVLVGAGTALWLAQFHASLSLIFLVGLALALVLAAAAPRIGSGKTAAHHGELRGRLHGDLTEWVQGLADLVAFGAQHRWRAGLAGVEAEFAAAQRQLSCAQALQGAAASLVANLTMAGLLFGGVVLVGRAGLDGVYLAAVALGSLAAFESVQAMPAAAISYEALAAGARRVWAVADGQPVVLDPPPLESVPELPGGLSLDVRHLSFGYPGDRGTVLRDVSFSLAPGQRVAIVGPSGAGKSTLVNILLRFWDYSQGEIRVNGVDLRSLTGTQARGLFAVVPQDVYLFDGTVRENLLLARPGASDEDLSRAVRLAAAEDFVQSLPQGYDTWVGEHGMLLSAGERQRLAIARALLQPGALLLLDEPTAYLDSLTEGRVIAGLLAGAEGRTLLWITHRLVGLDAMDDILVMDRGRIVEQGTEDELLAREGVYRRLWRAQREAWETLGEGV